MNEILHWIFLSLKTKLLFNRCLLIVQKHIDNYEEIKLLIKTKDVSKNITIFHHIGDKIEARNIDVTDLWRELKTVSIWYKMKDTEIIFIDKLKTNIRNS